MGRQRPVALGGPLWRRVPAAGLPGGARLRGFSGVLAWLPGEGAAEGGCAAWGPLVLWLAGACPVGAWARCAIPGCRLNDPPDPMCLHRLQ